MNPTYIFTLSAAGGAERDAYPVYKDDLAKEYKKQTGQEFFRAELSGKLTFVRDDYAFIVAQPFDTEFVVRIYISYDGGLTWTEYWKGNFWKTNCTFNADDRNLTVTPEVLDRYTAVLNGLDKEFDLIKLNPAIQPVVLDKRPLIQVYVPGQSVISCFLSGMYWEQECEVVEETDKVIIDSQDYPALTHKYFFALNKSYTGIQISGNMSPQLPENVLSSDGKYFDFIVGAYRYVRHDGRQYGTDIIQISNASNNVVLWQGSIASGISGVYSVTLSPVGGGATGNVTLDIVTRNVYARYILDTEELSANPTHEIPSDDLCPDNRNYSRCIGYTVQDTVWFSDRLVSAPTEWGIYQPGLYYQVPLVAGVTKFCPIAKSAWGRYSLWFTFSTMDWAQEMMGRKSFELKDAFPIYSVIFRLLEQVAPGVTHEGTTDYSQFLYAATNPVYGPGRQKYFLTPKSNIIHAGYDQPAQKAPVTLKNVLEMLRDCFRCYWFIDDDGRFRIEHVKYFRGGGSYSGGPSVGRDLTTEEVRPGGKKWSFATSSYQYDKPDMAGRYQFKWMDDVTQLFEGNPLDIVSGYVKKDNVEQIDVAKFTSDIDYILLNPNDISKDGFVLLTGEPLAYRLAANATAGRNFSRDYDVVIPAGSTFTVKVTAASGIFRDDFLVILFDHGASGIADGVDINRTVSITAMRGARKLTFYRIGRDVLASGPVSIAIDSPNDFKVPYVGVTLDGADYLLQNGYCAFFFLQDYYRWDMPAWTYVKDGVQMTALGVKKLKTQTLAFPALTDPDLSKLVKTAIGDGEIDRIAINLSSRNAKTTLRYEPEQ